MKLIDMIRGYSTQREVQATFNEDGSRGPLMICERRYDYSNRNLISEGWGGPLTIKEKKHYEAHPEEVVKSPFSWVPYEELNLSPGLLDFAEKVKRFLDESATTA